MSNEDVVQLEYLLPAQIIRTGSFLLPVIITNIGNTPIAGNLTGTIQLSIGLILKPNQSEEIQFGHLNPRQKVVLSWILIATEEGSHYVKVQIQSKGKVITTKIIRIVVSS